MHLHAAQPHAQQAVARVIHRTELASLAWVHTCACADEIVKAVEEFYLCDDPDAPGNWLLGPY